MKTLKTHQKRLINKALVYSVLDNKHKGILDIEGFHLPSMREFGFSNKEISDMNTIFLDFVIDHELEREQFIENEGIGWGHYGISYLTHLLPEIIDNN